MSLQRFVPLSLLLLACAAAAQTARPGLWEMSNQISGSGEAAAAMAAMQKQMASLPPEQRKMVQEMMAKNGVSMGAGGEAKVRFCMTREMAEKRDFGPNDGNCQYKKEAPSGGRMKYSFSCANPASSGQGVVSFQGDAAFSNEATVTTNAIGRTETMQVTSSAKWLAADCGTTK